MTGVTRHRVVILAFVAAVVCYVLGFQSAALSLVVAGMICEAVFWFHLLLRRK